MADSEYYNLVIKAGEYLDKDGERRAIWRTIGKLFMSDSKRRPMILMDRTFNPAGVWIHPDFEESGSIQITCVPPDEKAQNG